MAWAALPVAGILLLAGCGDDDKDDKGSSSTAPSSAPSSQAPAPSSAAPTSAKPTGASSAPAGAVDQSTWSADQKAAAAAYGSLFDPKTPVADRKALITDSESIAPLIDGLLAHPVMGTASLKVKDVKVTGDKAAVTFDVLISGAPAYENRTGEAVKVDGKWKVSKSVICGFGQGLGVQLPPGCAA
ncbi:IseA DL-endopeptidase inhibitor family protein [Yinghuangia soli]|uniref:IseA DL-endopeptidase inhibitor family protein n=1 Tax=Yinghuangia soli TaxID=2908204 RepID=A0AA41Q7E6_9ACTN|nr:IseA DL-endopeptidase inhibitor family protein [Yinghuangia soli]MCF2532990.1 IseA DL-endopeptidase inhibitor family protein [Yinghuangia soli]